MYNFILDDPRKAREAYITIASYGITFPSSALDCLEHAEYVHVFYDEENRAVAFQACEKDEFAFRFYPKTSKLLYLRWSGCWHRDRIARLARIKPSKKGVKIKGKMMDGMLVFDLRQSI